MKFAQLTKMTEDEARHYLEGIRWPNGPVCAHCGSTEVTKLQGKATRPGVYKCKSKECRKKFTVTVNTIFEKSHIAIRNWAMAFHLMCASKKGISAHQLHRMIGITYKSAWFMCHRIRHAMTEGMDKPMTGVVEADETYVGGKPRYHKRRDQQKEMGRATPKAPVLVLVERDGRAVCRPVADVSTEELRKHVVENVSPEAKFMTDEWPAYNRIGRSMIGGHYQVNHGKKEYARMSPDGTNVNTNTAESFFALLKRGHYGTFHKMSKHHLHRYCTEFAFRWTRRKMSDGERMIEAIRGAEGKRLTYR